MLLPTFSTISPPLESLMTPTSQISITAVPLYLTRLPRIALTSQSSFLQTFLPLSPVPPYRPPPIHPLLFRTQLSFRSQPWPPLNLCPWLIAARLPTSPTGSKGQYTQWVHCELIVGPKIIRPAHTQQVNSGHIQKVPTNLPSEIPSRYILVIFKKCPSIRPAHTQQVSGGHFYKVPSTKPSGYFLNELTLFFHKVFKMYPEGIL